MAESTGRRTPSEAPETALREGTISAGEIDSNDQLEFEGRSSGEVVIGEIPDEDDTTSILWTARCSNSEHGLLGQFSTRVEATQAADKHIKLEHREE